MSYILGACLIASIIGNVYLVKWCIITARQERQGLENRLLAMTNTEAYVAIEALEDQDEEPGTVSYIDERRMVEIENQALEDRT